MADFGQPVSMPSRVKPQDSDSQPATEAAPSNERRPGKIAVINGRVLALSVQTISYKTAFNVPMVVKATKVALS